MNKLMNIENDFISYNILLHQKINAYAYTILLYLKIA